MDILFPNEQSSPESGTYQKEISHMMHGFGDSPTPASQTVSLVGSIVLQQMRGILHEALKNAERRGHKCVFPEDIIFLMRNNKIKLQRMLQFMKSRYLVKNKSKLWGEGYTNILLEEDNEANLKKKKKTFCEIVEFLDDTGELSKCLNYDIIKHQRNVRANKLSQGLSVEKYEAYHKARCTSFGFSQCKLAHTKLKQWLCPSNDINIAFQTYDLLSYLAYETVAQIVDLAFIVRQDGKGAMNDPFARLEGGNFCNPASLGNSLFVKTGQEGVSPITVAEVREAMRRFSTPRIGTVGLFYRNIKNEIPMKFLAM